MVAVAHDNSTVVVWTFDSRKRLSCCTVYLYVILSFALKTSMNNLSKRGIIISRLRIDHQEDGDHLNLARMFPTLRFTFYTSRFTL